MSLSFTQIKNALDYIYQEQDVVRNMRSAGMDEMADTWEKQINDYDAEIAQEIKTWEQENNDIFWEAYNNAFMP